MSNPIVMSTEANLANNMAFMFADFMESMLMVAESEFKRHGRAMKHEHKVHFTKTLFNAKKLREVINLNSEKSQLNWAEDADYMLELIMLFIDRTGNNTKTAKLFCDYIRAFPSVSNVDLTKFGVKM